MAPTTSLKQAGNGLERVRAQFLTALHVGKLRPGDRVPSVRRLADLTGMNRKTVHRAYQTLAGEGLLDLRRGSGTFISDGSPGTEGHPSAADLLRSANRCRAEAATLGLAPGVFAAFLGNYLGKALHGLPMAVAECNREQIGIIADELQGSLGIVAKPVLLPELAADPGRALEGTWGVVTTDCHRGEVASLAAPVAPILYSVALDRGFPQRLVEYARNGPVVMVVRDQAFAPVFLRLLRQMAVPAHLLSRIRIVEPQEARAAALEAGEDATVYVSPLVERVTAGRLPERLRRLNTRWRLSEGSLDRLKVQLALDLTVRGMES